MGSIDMANTHIWLRAESKPMEHRVPLTLSHAQELLKAGFTVTVEESSQRAISCSDYKDVGCDVQAAHSWRHASADTIVLGLKELAEETFPLIHRHIHFAHVYKNQQGWREQLSRFADGKGELYDLEFLVDADNRRVAAFGYWAGFIGAALALQAWGRTQQQAAVPLPKLAPWPDKQSLVDDVKSELSPAVVDKCVKVLVIGAKGRSGSGAVELARGAGAEVTEWDVAETKAGGPFPEILGFDVLVNCVFVQSALPPFLTSEMLLDESRRLSVISDVSCDLHADYNPLPIYQQCTDFEHPTLRILEGENPLDVISIDHLPSMLPVESSEDFSQQLLPHLLQVNDLQQGVWENAHRVFQEKLSQI